MSLDTAKNDLQVILSKIGKSVRMCESFNLDTITTDIKMSFLMN